MMMSNGMRANPRPATLATLALSFDGGAIDYIILERITR